MSSIVAERSRLPCSRNRTRGPLAVLRPARRLLTLGLSGLFVAMLARRPEFAGLAAPALLLLVAGRVQRRPPRIAVLAQPSSRRVFEGERMALDVTVDIPGEISGDGGRECQKKQCRKNGAGKHGARKHSAGTRGALEAAPGPGDRPGRHRGGRRAAGPFLARPGRLGTTADRHAGGGAAGPLAAGRGPRDHDLAHARLLPGPGASSGPRWCSGGCRTGSASTRPGPPGRASSSPGCASTCRVTGSAASTGRPAPGAGGCR